MSSAFAQSGNSAFQAPVGHDRALDIKVNGGPADREVLPARQSGVIQQLEEGFGDITTLPDDGWALINNSEPLGTSGWFQGNPGIFPAHEGDLEMYIGANHENTTDVGTISNWLLTPEIELANGTELRFWTRTTEQFEDFYDRIEVRMSPNGGSTDVGDTAESVGDFTELLLTINPDLEAGEYPEKWTEFVVTISGLDGPTTGHLAFRYWVTDAGPNGSNGDYIGIDSVTLTQTIQPAPVAGWRMLAVPGNDLTVQDMANLNLVQGVNNGPYPDAAPNLFYAYTGPTSEDYEPVPSMDLSLFPGDGFFWYLYDDGDFPASPPPEFVDIEDFILPIGMGTAIEEDVTRLRGLPETEGDDLPAFMIGNPFQEAFRLSGVSVDVGQLQTTFFAWDPEAASYVELSMDDLISPWQGVWAEIEDPAQFPQFTFAFDAVETDEDPPIVGLRSTDVFAVEIDLRGTLEGGKPVADLSNCIRFEPDAMTAWDRHDASKFYPPLSTEGYALLSPAGVRNGNPYRQAVRSLPSSLAEAETIPVALLTTEAGSFEISATVDRLPEGWNVTLHDLETGNETDLPSESYAFTSNSAEDWQNRFEVTITPAGVVGSGREPEGFRLSTPAPNPATESTALVLRVDEAQTVTARVYDALGRLVTTVHQGALEAGEETRFELDTSTLAASAYVVRVEGESFAETRRFAVIR